MEGVDIRGRAARVLTKNQGGDTQLVAAQRADAPFGNGDPNGGSVWIIYGDVQDLQREKPRRRGARSSSRHGALPGIALVLLTFAGWCQHLYTCFNEGLWGFLIAGAILSPIGIIHGWAIWFGWE